MTDVRPHADAMTAMREALWGFRAEEQMVIVSGLLGEVLASIGRPPTQSSAVAMIGPSFEMVLDMIDRTFRGTEQ